MARLGPRQTWQMAQSPNYDTCATWRPSHSKHSGSLGSSLCRCSTRVKQSSTSTWVAAAERNRLARVEPQVVLPSQQREDVVQSTSLLSASWDLRAQQVDVPSSPPSTSGRTDSHNDLPFLPGSRRRLRNPTGRRHLSTASFYGEYCDMKATQRMVSTIWERLMVQGGTGAEDVSDGDDKPSSTNHVAASPAAVLPPAAQQQQLQSPIPSPSGVPQQQPNGAAAGAEGDGALHLNPATGHPTGRIPTIAVSSSRPISAGNVFSFARTTPSLPLADGWSITPASGGGGGSDTTTFTPSPLPSSPPPSRPSPHKRVILYLGPEFELQLPPPPAVRASPFEEIPPPSWSWCEQELLESMNAPKPRRIRGCMLSTPEVVREVSFGTAATAPAPVTATRSKRGAKGDRSARNGMVAAAPKRAVHAIDVANSIGGAGLKQPAKKGDKAGGVETAAAEVEAGEEERSPWRQRQDLSGGRRRRRTTAAAAAESQGAREADGCSPFSSSEQPLPPSPSATSFSSPPSPSPSSVASAVFSRWQPGGTVPEATAAATVAAAPAATAVFAATPAMGGPEGAAVTEGPTGTTTSSSSSSNGPGKSAVAIATGGTSRSRGSLPVTITKMTATAKQQQQGVPQQQLPGHEGVGEPRQMARQRDLLEALVERLNDTVVTERIQQLAVVNRTGITAINFVLQALGKMGHVKALSRLLTLQVALGLYNEHTYGTAFRALHRAGRLDMVLGAFQEACRSGRDLGPIACSVLLHVASLERNIKLAWQLFDQMVANEMTLNRYSYNCIAHLASLHGALDDVRLIYSMMKSEAAAASSDCRPDSYTYAALVRAAFNAGRGDLLPALFNEMVASQRAEERAVGRPRPLAPGQGEGRLSHEVWGHFLCAALRTGQIDLALRFFAAGITELGLLPNREVYNILLAGLAKSRPLPELLGLYSEMVHGCLRPAQVRGLDGGGVAAVSGVTWSALGLASVGVGGLEEPLPPGTVLQPPVTPDHYTFNALLTAAAHHMADLPTLEGIRREMTRHGVNINTFIGTSLINAYRRTPELSRAATAAAAAAAAAGGTSGAAAASPSSPEAAASAGATSLVVAAAEEVMSELMGSNAASVLSYTCMAAFYATARRPVKAVDCVRQMATRGLTAADSAWQFLVSTAEDAGQYSLARVFASEQRRQMAERQARRLQQQ